MGGTDADCLRDILQVCLSEFAAIKNRFHEYFIGEPAHLDCIIDDFPLSYAKRMAFSIK